jgi:hypothetical protein
MNVHILSRRKRAVVKRSACLELAELAADASILLGIRWAVVGRFRQRTLSQLVEELRRCRSLGSTLELPHNLDFFPELDFEVPQVRNSCLFLVLVAKSVPSISEVDPSRFLSLDGISSIAKVDSAIFKTLSKELVEIGEPVG